MRKGIDYIGVGVGAVIHDGNGRYFLMLRGEKAKNERGKWEFPGGAVEFGETLENALAREMKEEFDVEIEVGEMLDVCNHIIHAEGQHWVSPTYLCTVRDGAPRICEPGKCAEIGWFTLDEMEQLPLSIITAYNLKNLRKHLSIY